MGVVIRLIINALSIFFAAQILPGITVEGLYASLIVAIVLSIVNAFIKPLILLFTLPLTILTLGLFTFVVNALMIMIVDYFVPGFAVDGFISALLFSLVLSIINSILVWFVK